ncbi:MAG TPA: NAD-dependent epimerase/dehydratase family protein [Pseudonocardiaceae bacterium]|jgi:UDP-glucose 4-epimerase
MSARIVVTGGSGFIGGHLIEQLLARGDEVTVIDDRASGDTRIRHVTGNILDPAALAQAITPGTDLVFHLAAVVGVDQYLARPLDVIDVNFTGTRNVLQRSTDVGAKVVVASTSEVFGKNPAVPWREDDDRVLGTTAADRWTYSSSKALTEHLTFAFVRQLGLEATIVRYFNAYGPRQRPGFVVSRSVHRALNGKPVLVYDGGEQTRCFTYIEDAVRGTLLAAANPVAIGQAFNIGSMTETTIGQVAELIADLTGAAIKNIETSVALGPSYEDLARRIPDNTKARTVLGWSPEITLKEGLERTIAWAREDERWLAQPDTGASA